MPIGPTPLWDQGQCQVIGQTYAGFSSLRTLLKDGRHANMVHSDTLGFRPNSQSCHHEVWLHLVPIRDFFAPFYILVVRTAGHKWNQAKLYGSFAALWFFLMEKDESERRRIRAPPRMAQPVS